MNRLGFYSLALLILAADQLSKQWVVRAHSFWPEEGRSLIPGLFSLTYVNNTGGAFGILPSLTSGLAVAAAVAAVAIVVFTLRARMPLPALLAVALALPLGGALGNLLDRVRLGYVVDFLDLHVGPHQWPVFNVADGAICIGVALLALHYWRQPEAPPEPSAAPVAAKEKY